MGDITPAETEEAVKPASQEVKPRVNRHGSWSAFEIQEWRKKIGEAFDQMAHLGDAARFEKEHGVEQHPKPNGFERIARLGEDLEKDVVVRAEEVEAGRNASGFGPALTTQPKTPGSSKT